MPRSIRRGRAIGLPTLSRRSQQARILRQAPTSTRIPMRQALLRAPQARGSGRLRAAGKRPKPPTIRNAKGNQRKETCMRKYAFVAALFVSQMGCASAQAPATSPGAGVPPAASLPDAANPAANPPAQNTTGPTNPAPPPGTIGQGPTPNPTNPPNAQPDRPPNRQPN